MRDAWTDVTWDPKNLLEDPSTPVTYREDAVDPLVAAVARRKEITERRRQEEADRQRLAEKSKVETAAMTLDPLGGGFDPLRMGSVPGRSSGRAVQEATDDDVRFWGSTLQPEPISTSTIIPAADQTPFDARLKELGLLDADSSNNDLRTLTNRMRLHWHNNEKVPALRSLIAACKQFQSTSATTMLGRRYAYIAEAILAFGNLVNNRIKDVCTELLRPSRLPEDFHVAELPTQAREMALNWKLKIATIRELVPRILVTAGTLHVLRFISDESAIDTVELLIRQCRGLAEPILAIFCRAFVLEASLTVIPAALLVNASILAIVDTHKQLRDHSSRVGQLSHMDLATVAPAIRTIAAPLCESDDVMDELQELIMEVQYPELLLGVFGGLAPKVRGTVAPLVVDAALRIEYLPEYPLPITLGRIAEYLCDPDVNLPSALTMQLLRTALKQVLEEKSLAAYITAVGMWANVALLHGPKQSKFVIRIYKDLAKRVSSTEEPPAALLPVLTQIVSACPDPTSILVIDPLLGLISMLESDAQTKLNGMLLSRLSDGDPSTFKYLDSPIVRVGTLSLCQSAIAHLGITYSAEKSHRERQIARVLLLPLFNDPQQVLPYLTSCRAAFLGYDEVLKNLILFGLGLLPKISTAVGRPPAKEVAQLKAILAFIQVTLPSIDDPQFSLTTLATVTAFALRYGLLALATDMYSVFLSTISTLPAHIEHDGVYVSTRGMLYPAIAAMLSQVVLLPALDPSKPWHHISDLLEALENCSSLNMIESGAESDVRFLKTRLNMIILSTVVGLLQKSCPYAPEGLDTNHSIFNITRQYKPAGVQLCNDLMLTVLEELTPHGPVSPEHGTLLLELLNTMLAFWETDSADLRILLDKIIPMLDRARVWDSTLGANLKKKLRFEKLAIVS